MARRSRFSQSARTPWRRTRGRSRCQAGARASRRLALRTALRETHEELGIDPDRSRYVEQLPDVDTVVSNFTITPFVAHLSSPPSYEPDPARSPRCWRSRYPHSGDRISIWEEDRVRDIGTAPVRVLPLRGARDLGRHSPDPEGVPGEWQLGTGQAAGTRSGCLSALLQVIRLRARTFRLTVIHIRAATEYSR